MKTLQLSPLFLILIAVTGTFASEAERKLITKLMANYSILERPVKNTNDTLQLEVGAAIISLQNVNEKEGTIETVLWLRLRWADNYLQWTPAEYDGITDIKLPITSIWKPDVHAYNSHHDLFDVTYETKAVITSNGSVLYVPPGNHKTSCNMDFTLYPFEKLACNMTFGSWTYDGGQVNLTLYGGTGGDATSYIENSEWALTGFPSLRKATYYACCPDPYVDITFTLNIQRKGEVLARGYRIINTFICLMILISFIVTPVSGQKTIIGIGTMICNIWTINNLNSALPQHHTCQLVSYFETLCGLVFSSVIANLITTFIYFGTWPMPDVIRKVFLENIPQILRFICPQRNTFIRINTELRNTKSFEGRNEQQRHSTDDGGDLLDEIDDFRQCSGYQIYQNDWNYLACMLDRCFFVVYTLCIFIFLVAIYPSFD